MNNNSEPNKILELHEIRTVIKDNGFKFYSGLPEQLKNIAGEFMYLNEDYVLAHQGDTETQLTKNILAFGFTNNQQALLLDALMHYKEKASLLLTPEEKKARNIFINGCMILCGAALVLFIVAYYSLNTVVKVELNLIAIALVLYVMRQLHRKKEFYKL